MRAELWRGFKTVKEAYKREVECHLAWLVWQGLKSITNCKSSSTNTADALLAEELNNFLDQFEVKSPHIAALPSPQTSSNSTLTLQEYQVRQVLKAVNTRKTAKPDGDLGKVLYACANQLVGDLTKMFNLSLTQATIPPCLKSDTIVPVPKTPAPMTSYLLP